MVNPKQNKTHPSVLSPFSRGIWGFRLLSAQPSLYFSGCQRTNPKKSKKALLLLIFRISIKPYNIINFPNFKLPLPNQLSQSPSKNNPKNIVSNQPFPIQPLPHNYYTNQYSKLLYLLNNSVPVLLPNIFWHSNHYPHIFGKLKILMTPVSISCSFIIS